MQEETFIQELKKEFFNVDIVRVDNTICVNLNNFMYRIAVKQKGR